LILERDRPLSARFERVDQRLQLHLPIFHGETPLAALAAGKKQQRYSIAFRTMRGLIRRG